MNFKHAKSSNGFVPLHLSVSRIARGGENTWKSLGGWVWWCQVGWLNWNARDGHVKWGRGFLRYKFITQDDRVWQGGDEGALEEPLLGQDVWWDKEFNAEVVAATSADTLIGAMQRNSGCNKKGEREIQIYWRPPSRGRRFCVLSTGKDKRSCRLVFRN